RPRYARPGGDQLSQPAREPMGRRWMEPDSVHSFPAHCPLPAIAAEAWGSSRRTLYGMVVPNPFQEQVDRPAQVVVSAHFTNRLNLRRLTPLGLCAPCHVTVRSVT